MRILAQHAVNQHNRQTHGGVNPNSANTTIVVAQQQQQQQHQEAQIQVVHTTSDSQHIVQHVEQQSQHQQQAQQQTVTVVSSQPNNGIVTISTPETLPSRPQYACRECGQEFNSREALALYLRLHTGDKSLMTDLCALTVALTGHFLTSNLQQGTVLTSNHSFVQQTPVPVQIISTGQVIQQGNIVQSSPSHPQTIQVQQVQPQQQQQQQVKKRTNFRIKSILCGALSLLWSSLPITDDYPDDYPDDSTRTTTVIHDEYNVRDFYMTGYEQP